VCDPGWSREALHIRASQRVICQFGTMIQNLVAFTAAALLEILGCFTFWLWLRRGASPIAAIGIFSLIGFAVGLIRVGAAFAGRAYAAYGGIHIAGSLVWLWLVEGQQPTGSDLLGASIAIMGALVIVGLAARP
jgi:small multidrug resistance family-3 protein